MPVALDPEIASAVIGLAAEDDTFGEHLFALASAASGSCSSIMQVGHSLQKDVVGC
jgi:hypothetical protein